MKNLMLLTMCTYLFVNMGFADDVPVRYFGYYHAYTAFGSDIPYMDGITNLNHVYSWHLPNMTGTKSKALIDLRWTFFDGAGKLNANWQTSWNLRINEVTPYLDYVGGFYVMDEPYWNGVSYDDLKAASDTIKATFPDKPVMTTISWKTLPTLVDANSIPESIDWVGFDYYDDFETIPEKLETLKSHLNPNQKVFLVPPSYTREGVLSDAVLAQWMYDYYDLAKSDETVIGMLVFLSPWQVREAVFAETTPLPLTIAAQQQIGAEIYQSTRYCGDVFTEYQFGDISQDCFVDMQDFALFAESWLTVN